MRSSLDAPDSHTWLHHPYYSPDVADALRRAYRLIAEHKDRISGYVAAARIVSPLHWRRMMPQQLLRVYYVLAMSLAALEAHRDCLDQLDRASDIAEYLEDTSALSTLHYLRAFANRDLFHFRDAASGFRRSLELLTLTRRKGHLVDTLQVAHLLTLEATMRFFLGDHPLALHLLDEARAYIPSGERASLDANTITWIQALIDRWSGRPQAALPSALRAAEAYMRAAPTASAVRIQNVIADIQLDLADAAPIGSSQRANLLEGASSHLDLAARMAVAVGDVNGDVLTRLVQTRASRLRGDNIGRVGLLEGFAQEGRHLHDELLVIQAFTTLGDELVARGELVPGLNCYREVVRLTDGGDLVAPSYWAKQALDNHAWR